MDEQERNYLSEQIRGLERSKRRWRLATFTLAAVLVMILVVGGVSSLFMARQAMVQRARAEDAYRQAVEAEHQLRQVQKADERKQP